MEKLKKKLDELNLQKQELEYTFHQIIGGIKTVEALIKESKEDSKKDAKK